MAFIISPVREGCIQNISPRSHCLFARTQSWPLTLHLWVFDWRHTPPVRRHMQRPNNCFLPKKPLCIHERHNLLTQRVQQRVWFFDFQQRHCAHFCNQLRLHQIDPPTPLLIFGSLLALCCSLMTPRQASRNVLAPEWVRRRADKVIGHKFRHGGWQQRLSLKWAISPSVY